MQGRRVCKAINIFSVCVCTLRGCYLVAVQSVQKFAFNEVQDLERAVTGCSDEEVTGWMKGQAVHHPTVDWETQHNTRKFLTCIAQIY